jgi:hypothetical protein
MERSNYTPAAPTAPRLAGLWAAALHALFALALGFPALGGRFLVNPYSDQYIAGYAFRDFGASVLRDTGGFPLWNPYIFGGMPFVAGMHGDIFYPTFLLRLVMPTDAAMTWGFIIHLALAGLGTYCFLRALGLGFFPALTGGAAYQLSGALASLVSPGHDGQLFVSALLPFAMLLILRTVRDGRAWAWGALAIVVGLAVLSPHPVKLQYMLIASGAFALHLVFGGEGDRLARRPALRRLGAALAMIVLGFLIGAIQYVPVNEYVPWSPRAGGRGYEYATAYSMHVPQVINGFLPQFGGILANYWGENGIHLNNEYLGAAMFVLAFAGLGSSMRLVRSRLFWAGVVVVGMLWALGNSTPFYRLVYAIVPGTKYFRTPDMMLFVPTFAFAVLGAYGAERVLAGRVSTRYALGWAAFALAVAVIATLGGITNLASAMAGPERYDIVQANRAEVLVGAWRSFLAVAAMAAVIWLVARRRFADLATAGGLLVAVVALDLWSVARRFWAFSPPAAELFARDPIVDYLASQSDSTRVLTVPLRQTEVARDPYFSGDALMRHRVRQVMGYHGNELGRYQRLYGADDFSRQLANPNFWQLTNLRYWYTNVEQPPLEGMTRVLGPVKNSVGSTAYLYRSPGEQPAAWVAAAIVKAPDEQVLATVLEPRFNLRSVALFDSAAAVQGRADLRVAPDTVAVRATVTRPASDQIRVALDAPAPAGSALVVAENFYPGWTATVDGRPGVAERADYVLIGVPLPAGARRVDLRFASPRYELGKSITLAALAASLLLLLGGAVLDRRARV